MSPFDNGPILKFSIRTMLEFGDGTMLESNIGTMLESSTESVLHFDIHPTPIQCRKSMSFRNWNVGCRHWNDIVPILETKEACKIAINDTVYNVDYELMCTMINGKVCQVITDNFDSSNCTVCEAKPSEMNHLQRPACIAKNEEAPYCVNSNAANGLSSNYFYYIFL